MIGRQCTQVVPLSAGQWCSLFTLVSQILIRRFSKMKKQALLGFCIIAVSNCEPASIWKVKKVYQIIQVSSDVSLLTRNLPMV